MDDRTNGRQIPPYTTDPSRVRKDKRMKKPLMIVHKQGKPPWYDIPAILDRVRVNVGLRPNELS